jgi:hypothetical protein
LLEGKAEELVRKAVEVALGGDVAMLKSLLGRILPRERLITLESRMVFPDSAVEALGIIIRAVAEGMISPSEAAALATLMNSYSDAIDMADVVQRRRVANR